MCPPRQSFLINVFSRPALVIKAAENQQRKHVLSVCAVQVLPYLQTLSRAPSRLWLHALLPRSWAYIWNGSITERASPAMQGSGAAAVQAALEAAVAAALGPHGAAEGRGVGSHGAAAGGQGGAAAAGVVDASEDASEEIETDSSDD